jgi:AraC-like DNA-binding protein
VAGGAYAASQPSSNPEQAFINDAAQRLHVSPTQLTNALRQALIDRIDAAVVSGQLTRAQAQAITQRIEHSPGVPFGPGLIAPGMFGAQVIIAGGTCPTPGMGGPAWRMAGPPRGVVGPPWAVVGPPWAMAGPPWAMAGPPVILTSAASYLSLTDNELMRQLVSGKSLAQIARARGKSESGLERAITSAVSSQLEKAVAAGRIPRAVEKHLLEALSRHVQDFVNASGPPGPPGPPRQVLRFSGHGPPPPVLRCEVRPRR